MREADLDVGSREWGVGSGCFTTPKTLISKRAFGIIEVVVASLVLGFLIVGLNILQKGNREGVLRIRARDAANFVAQHLLDSLGSIGLNSLVADGDGFVYSKDDYIYYFEGKPQSDKNTDAIKIPIKYNIQVQLLQNTDDSRHSIDSTYFTIANRPDANTPSEKEINTITKGLEATISWEFKKSIQSIKMAKLVR